MMRLLSKSAGAQGTRDRDQNDPPSISIVIAAHNEENAIHARLKNLLDSDYPADQLEIVVVSDGSTDGTARAVHDLDDARVRVLERLARTGKAACLNAGVHAAKGEVIVFADARQRFVPDAIRNLAKAFVDPEFGAVSGALDVNPAESGVGKGVDAYWRFEKALRLAEAKWDSAIGCTGAIYAIRRSLYVDLPEDTLLDDVVTPMNIAVAGLRVGFEPTAVAWDHQQLEPDRERIRKRRTLAGNFQMLFRYPEWLNPSHNRLWWQLLSHKYFRLLCPFCLLGLFFANIGLTGHAIYQVILIGQAGFYGAALLGFLQPAKKWRVITIASGFVFLNWMVVEGLWYYCRSGGKGAWERASQRLGGAKSCG